MSTPPHGRRGWTAGPALLVALGLAAALEPASGADEEAGRSRSDRSQPGEALPGGGPLPGGLAFDSKGITYRSGDGLFEANLGGRLHLDFGGEGRGAALGERSLWRGQVRRTWGELALTYERVWAFGLQVDAAGGDQPIYDLALGYSGLGPFVVTVGNFKEPFSLKQLQSNNEASFMERSLADALVPARNVGLAVGRTGSAGLRPPACSAATSTSATAAWPRPGGSPTAPSSTRRAAGLSISVSPAATVRSTGPRASRSGPRRSRRCTTCPSSASTRSGARAASRDWGSKPPSRTGSSARRRSTSWPRWSGTTSAAARGGTPPSRAATSRPPTCSQGRPAPTSSSLATGRPTRCSAASSWPRRTAWAGAGRALGKSLEGGGLRGGVEYNATLGLTWYPDKNLRVMANYVRAFGSDLLGEGRRASVDIVQFRLQIAFRVRTACPRQHAGVGVRRRARLRGPGVEPRRGVPAAPRALARM